MAGLAKTNDTGDDKVTKWIWVDSNHYVDVLQTLVEKNLIDKEDSYNPQKLSYFKVTTKRENVEKIQDAIRDMNEAWFPQGMSYPTQDYTPKARLASTTPLAAKLEGDPQTPTVTIELTYTYECLAGAVIKPLVAELIKGLKKAPPYDSEEKVKGVLYRVTVNENPREFVFKPTLQDPKPVTSAIIVSANAIDFHSDNPDAENDVYKILNDMKAEKIIPCLDSCEIEKKSSEAKGKDKK
ncbi:PREDICTED: uncharacterized protein LOC109590977 [Amphimedon queenslandica]|uniref:Uncharacterized protein n=1 Tax=Amphimedon queenslandica TaxID=400682 RepID=A0A1X7SXC0_AMPQE|nr:PREDICTED: uncharacterized protein LOC109590977 [Amphimedon queenslandica]|eukprot:XP_019862362.1 PREDICTED: uncharacterized protein LOC109590977 [Amphimedon queenslandica]